MSRKTVITDEYRYESVDETTIRYVPPPSPPPPVLYRPVSTTTLYRSPSLTSITTYETAAPVFTRTTSFRRPSSLRRTDSSVSIKYTKDTSNTTSNWVSTSDNSNNNRVISSSVVVSNDNSDNNRVSSHSSFTKSKNEDDDYQYDYKYNYTVNETVENKRRPSLPRTKSVTYLSKIDLKPSYEIVQTIPNSLTYVYDYNSNNDSDRRITYVKHSENANPGLSLEGCLMAASPALLPVNRSCNLGALFNGNAFGLLTEHIQIKDTFNVSFQFRTTARNGILLMLVDSYSNDSFFIEMYDSQLKATLFVDGEPDSCWTDFSSPVLSNYIWADCNVGLVGNRLTMSVKNEFFSKHHRRSIRLPIRGDLFVAGHPSTIVPPFVCRSRDFFVGEMKDFHVNYDGIKWYGAPTILSPRLRIW